MSFSYLLLGANLGDRFSQLAKAVQEIERDIGSIFKSSSVFETAAWGREEEPAYLNQVVYVETNLAPFDLLKVINRIEEKLGRTRELKWESRLIDIDILFYNNAVINEPKLIIPHPYIHLRKFTLVPLAEIAPELMHPILQKSVQELLDELDDPLEVEKMG